jgi:hypothetical protein
MRFHQTKPKRKTKQKKKEEEGNWNIFSKLTIKKDRNKKAPFKTNIGLLHVHNFLKRGSEYATGFGALFRPFFQAFSKLE